MAMQIAEGGMQIMQAKAQKGQLDAQREIYEQERKNTLTAAQSDEAARRSRLADILQTQTAIRSGLGVSSYGPQGDAIAESSRREAEADIGAAQMTYLNKAERLKQSGALLKQQGKQIMTGAYLGVGFNLLKQAASAVAGGIGAGAGVAVPGGYGAPGVFSAGQLPRTLDGRIAGGV